jgi:cytochrome P450
MKYTYPKKIPVYKLLFNANSLTRNPIPFHHQYFNACGDSFTVANSRKRKIFLTRDPKIAKQILQQKHKKYQKSEIQTKFLSKYVGFGLLTSNGDLWLKQRRLIQPAFHKKKLEKLVQIIANSIHEEFQKIPENRFVDVYAVMNELAFNVVAKSLFSFSSDKATLARLQHIIAELQLFIVKELRQPHKRWWFSISGQVRQKLMLSKESRAILLEVITKRKAAKAVHDDLLDMLLKATYEDDGSHMADEQLIDEILILFVAGHETTANALTFATHFLANDKQQVEEVLKETQDVNTAWDIERLMQLPYTKAVVEETMRLYPPAWITDRVAMEDDDLGPYQIEKGAILGVSFYEMHRDPRYWKAPEKFDPSRFLGEQAKTHKGHYYPFGAGPRMCVGNNFAMYEMIIAIHDMVRSYRLEAATNAVKVNPLITLKPIDVLVKFSKRRHD